MSFSDPLVIIAAVAAAAIVAIVALAILPSTPAFKQMVVGVKADPQIVGVMRALLLYLIPTVIGGSVAYIQGWTDPRLLPLVPVLIGGIRVIEGRMDQLLKSGQNRVDPGPVAGGGSADLLGG